MESIDDPVALLAKERFGLDYLYPYQRLVAANALDAAAPGAEPMRQIVLLPTGFGKSLCFQLPALLLPGPTVVAYPLLALMEDQRRRLESLGIPCAVFRGGMDSAERAGAERSVERGEAKIVISNPECLGTPRLLDFLKEARPSHLAIDEAHCVSEWGETFRPAYLDMGRIADALAPPALSAFTATASPTVFEAVARLLFGGAAYRVVTGDPDRPNISYAVLRTLNREHSLVRLAREMPRPLLVFCSSREGVQIVSRLLRERLSDSEIRFYHAGLERPEKKRIEEWFFDSDRGILASTCAYGMGVDKKNIRSVIHYEAPASIEAYLQEAGRAGRDGLPSRAVLLAAPWDRDRLNRESDEGRKARFGALLDYAASEEGCRRDALLDLLGSPREGRPPCSGCDRCEGSDRSAFEGEGEILGFVRANARRFTVEEALPLLRGEESGSGEPPRCAGWGAMSLWETRDASRAMATALRVGLARMIDRGPWKGRLTVAPSLLDQIGAGLLGLGLRARLSLGRAASGRSGARAGGHRPRLPLGHLVVDEADVAQEGDGEQHGDGYEDYAPVRYHPEGKAKHFSQIHVRPPLPRQPEVPLPRRRGRERAKPCPLRTGP
jgi:ATP-dependent DNA helicase RecQ